MVKLCSQKKLKVSPTTLKIPGLGEKFPMLKSLQSRKKKKEKPENPESCIAVFGA